MITLSEPKRIVILGLGGIGSVLSTFLVRHVAFTPKLKDVVVAFVDGDDYEAKNAVRQNVGGLRNKAEVTQGLNEQTYPFVTFKSFKSYVGEQTKMEDGKLILSASKVLEENDWVFGCVDNNRTRLIVSKRMQELQNAVLIDGGNDLTDGSVQVFIRHEGMNITPPIEQFQSSISSPTDKAPFELSCEQLAASGGTQILPTNATAALMMYLLMWRLLENPVEPTEIASVGYFDILAALAEGPTMAFQKYPYTIGEKKP